MPISIRGPAGRRPLLTLPDAVDVDRRIAETEAELTRLRKLREMVDFFADPNPAPDAAHTSEACDE